MSVLRRKKGTSRRLYNYEYCEIFTEDMRLRRYCHDFIYHLHTSTLAEFISQQVRFICTLVGILAKSKKFLASCPLRAFLKATGKKGQEFSSLRKSTCFLRLTNIFLKSVYFV